MLRRYHRLTSVSTWVFTLPYCLGDNGSADISKKLQVFEDRKSSVDKKEAYRKLWYRQTVIIWSILFPNFTSWVLSLTFINNLRYSFPRLICTTQMFCMALQRILLWQITGRDYSPVAIHQRQCKINMVLIQFKQKVAQTILWTKADRGFQFHIQTQ